MEWNRKRVVTATVGVIVLAAAVYGAVLAYPRLTNPYYGLTTSFEVANMTDEIRTTIETRITAAKAGIAAAEQAGEKVDLDQYMIISDYSLVLGDLVAAREAMEEVLKENQGNPVAFNNYGYILERMGDYEGAEENYRKAIAISSPYEEYYRDLIVLIDEHFPERSGEIEPLLKEAVNAVGQTSWFMVELGRYYQSVDDCERAIAHYKVAITLEPDSQSIADEFTSVKAECSK